MASFLPSAHLQLALRRIIGLAKCLCPFLACPQGERPISSPLTWQRRSAVVGELHGPWVYDITGPGTRLMFLMMKGEPYYYPSSLINGGTSFTCYVPLVWGVHEWESNFPFKTQATSPLLKSRRQSWGGCQYITAEISKVEKAVGSL